LGKVRVATRSVALVLCASVMPKNETAKNVKARGSEAAGNFYVSLYWEIRRIWRILIIPLNVFYPACLEYKNDIISKDEEILLI
jgi:hypothetical protein